MAYTKLSMDKIFAENPDISIADLAAQSVADHSRENGCTFEDGAAARCISDLRYSPDARASDFSEEERERLALSLEAMETSCPHSKSN